MNNDLISRSALRAEYQAILDRGDMFCEYDIIGMVDNAPPIETTIEDVLSMLSEDSLEATEWVKVDTPSGKELIFEKRPQGEWKKDEWGNISCSNCGRDTRNPHYPFFCCYCGADMRGIYNEQKTADTSL